MNKPLFSLTLTHAQSDVDMHNTSAINYFQAFFFLPCQSVTNVIRKNSVVFAHFHSRVALSLECIWVLLVINPGLDYHCAWGPDGMLTPEMGRGVGQDP